MELIQINRAMFDHKNKERFVVKAPEGITEEVVRMISKKKNEPDWMLQKRLRALQLFQQMPLPTWGPDLSRLDLNKITYYAQPNDKPETDNWDEVPDDIKRTFERLGIPEAERKALSGVGAQYESQIVYHNLKKQWEDKGVIFENMDVAVQKYPELVKKYFMTNCVPIGDHKFAALHAAVWSGGTFIYVPPGIHVTMPLQAYFRMNAAGLGQFEHTLIIVDKAAEVHYIEGCFTRGTKIVCNPGYKQIEEIRIGDKVLTHIGEYKKVYEVHNRPLYTGSLYTINIWGDSTTAIECTEDHPFLIVKRKKVNERNKIWEASWTSAKYTREKDYVLYPIHRKIVSSDYKDFTVAYRGKEEIKRIALTKDFFRLIGYYLAEGSISKGSYLNFSFGSHEHEYINDVKAILGEMGVSSIHEVKHKKHNGTSIVVGDARFARIFKQFGTSAVAKNIPIWVMQEHPEKQRELIIGLFRGDGNYFNVDYLKGLKESIRLNTVSENLARQTRDMLLRLNIIAFINRRDRTKEARQAMYTVGITGEYAHKIGSLLGISVKNTLNGKKRATMFYLDNKYAYFPIKKVSKKNVENIKVYNFAVEDNESYVANIALVHNCSAPHYSKNNLHAGCVEVYVHEGARARYSSVENWSKNTYNLNTKRAVVDRNATMEWINGNMGSGCTMLYPCTVLRGEYAKADFIGIAFAGKDQNQDTGSKVIHLAQNTSSTIKSKSISKDGGISTYRGLLKIVKGAKNVKSTVQCDALLLDRYSKTNTIPCMEIKENTADVCHEATVGKISEDDIFYLMSRGLTDEEARKMIVSGFIEPVTKQLPGEYAIELNRLIELEMENAMG